MLFCRALDTPRPTPSDARPDFDLDELIDEYRLGSIQDVCKVRGGAVNKNWIVRTTMAVVWSESYLRLFLVVISISNILS